MSVMSRSCIFDGPYYGRLTASQLGLLFCCLFITKSCCKGASLFILGVYLTSWIYSLWRIKGVGSWVRNLSSLYKGGSVWMANLDISELTIKNN